jgi:hypothetical protein
MNTKKKQSIKYNLSIFKKCFCGTCGSLTEEQILKIYSSKWIIAENNSQIYQLFGKNLVK